MDGCMDSVVIKRSGMHVDGASAAEEEASIPRAPSSLPGMLTATTAADAISGGGAAGLCAEA